MSAIRDAYVTAGQAAVDLLSDPAVAAAWSAESALSRLSIGGLAAHLAEQVVFVARTVNEPAPAFEPVPLLEHYARATWLGADLDADVNVHIRDRGEAGATGGPATVAAI